MGWNQLVCLFILLADKTFSICDILDSLYSREKINPCLQVQSPVHVPWAKVVVPDMCRVYVVQARCMHTNGTGYWSDWSDSAYSTPQNTRGKTLLISLEPHL